ncbi:MAG: UvrD-helicase domain-containing protein [Sphingomonadaceae bacterium]|nr:UvrD-helicase domain-containing protein [Sphingomonadaceae bacterium]
MALILCDQRRRLLATDGNILVRGGAGSGKTTIALAKACADLAAAKLGPSGKALFLSFARATIARVAEQATATIPREHIARIEINTYHGFAWSILKSHAYLLCARPGVSLLLPAQARDRLAGLTGAARAAQQRRLFDEEGLIAFDLFPSLIAELFDAVPVLARAYAGAYRFIIVDEFQDTNADEWAMIARLGQQSRLMALGDPKQRIYDFKGADPRRFDEFIAAFRPTEFDFQSENRRSAGTDITLFADAVLTGAFRLQPYAGVTVQAYPGQSLRPLKQSILQAAARLRRQGEWSLAVLVPANVLAATIFDYMGRQEHGLPRYPVEILVSAEGPTLAGAMIALLLEPHAADVPLGALVLESLAAFEVGRNEAASASAIGKAAKLRKAAKAVRERGDAGYGARGVGADVKALLAARAALELTGDPMTDWRAIRALFTESPRTELQAVAKDARHMRLLRRGAQIEARLAEAWRTHGAYRDARDLLQAAVVEDQFAATGRPHLGVTVMTIHKAKGKEFDEVIVFEGPYQRYLRPGGAEAERSARFNLHVAATRARTAVTIMTPSRDPCRLLP